MPLHQDPVQRVGAWRAKPVSWMASETVILRTIIAQPVTQAPARTLPGAFALFRAVPYLLLLGTAFLVFSVSTDDPFITFRYALNLLRGFGPVYNAGERIEGFSSPLYVLVSAVLLKVAPSVDILFKAKLLGVGLAAIALAQTRTVGRLSGLTEREGVWAQILVALNVNFALAAVNGLETLLYACLILGAARAFLWECRGRGGDRSAAWLFGALLARPDAVLLFAAALGARAVWIRRRGLPWVRLLRWSLVFLVPAVLMLLARVAYYGDLLPNTYYAKDVDIRRGLTDGAWYALRPLSPIGWDPSAFARWGSLPLKAQQVGGIVFWGLFLAGAWRLRRRMGGLLCFALVGALVVFVLRCGGDWMPGLRFLAPILPLAAILQCHGLRGLARIGWRRSSAVLRLVPAGLVLALWGVCAWGACAWGVPKTSWAWAHFSTHSRDLLRASGTLGRKWVVTADSLHRNFPPRATLAYSEMGFAGLVNPDMTLIDVRGLTDREIARLPRSYKGTWGVDDETWFLPEDPMYGILTRRHPDAIIAFSHRQAPPFVLGRYQLLAAVRDPRDPAWAIGPTLIYLPPSAPPYILP